LETTCSRSPIGHRRAVRPLVLFWCFTSGSFKASLLATAEHSVAMKLLADEKLNMTTLIQHGVSGQAASKAGLSFLEYLNTTWMPEPLWQSWSQKGRLVAATILNKPVEGVLPTTNHLESFNGLLKRKYIRQWERSGTRLRFDFLIHILITKILPGIFNLRRAFQQYQAWLADRFKDSAGGADLTRLSPTHKDVSTPRNKGICWWPADEHRDREAVAIIRLRRLYHIRQQHERDQYEATCISSAAALQDPYHTRYTLYIHRRGHGWCSCPDFSFRGGACKHLRALRLVVDGWVSQNVIQAFYYPPTLVDAQRISPPPQNLPIPTPMTHNLALQSAAVLSNFVALQQMAGLTNIEGGSATKDQEMASDTENESETDCSEESPSQPAVVDFANMGREAISLQVQQRVDHLVANLLPRLHGLSNLAAESLLTATPNLSEFLEVIDTLRDNITSALGPTSPPGPLQQAPSLTPSFTRAKRSVKFLLPPSPEPKQKRKTSHDVR
jgi:SWIM zinc finger